MKHIDALVLPHPTHSRLRDFPLRTTPESEATPLDIGLPKIKLLLTIQETASILQVSLTTVRNMIDCGTLDAAPVNPSPNALRKHLRITRESAERFQKSRFGR